MWFRDKREKEQQRLCNIQRDDDAVHGRIMKCMRVYKSKEETVLHLLDQYDQHILLLLRIIASCYSERKTEDQDAFQSLLPFDIGKSVFPKGV
ncbi:unnamed protein product [Brassica oleracea]|uniref:(rape) hypothetical protein n=1 Tax=Brassica napus TaxID=3708 RepID=A0A816U7C6_BRANA|nr:unnamed protein product [Brassica napus]